MNYRKLIAATLAAALGFSAIAANAQPRDDRDNRGGPRHEQRGGPDRHHGKPQVGQHHAQPPQFRPVPRPHPGYMADHRGRGVGPDHRYYRGDRLPPSMRTRHYVVNDWRGHHLSAPPRGHRWVQVGADYVLIAVATGLIAQFVLSR